MSESILCLVVFFFLGWIIALKMEIQKLKEDSRKLKTMLKLDIREKTADVNIVPGKKIWGCKPAWMK